MGVNEPGVPGKEDLRADAQFHRGLDAHVVEEYVGIVDEFQEYIHPGLVFQIQDDASLAPVRVLKVVVIALETRHGLDDLHEAPGRVTGLCLDLHHIGAKVCEPHTGNGPLLKHRHFYNLNTLQRSACHP